MTRHVCLCVLYTQNSLTCAIINAGQECYVLVCTNIRKVPYNSRQCPSVNVQGIQFVVMKKIPLRSSIWRMEPVNVSYWLFQSEQDNMNLHLLGNSAWQCARMNKNKRHAGGHWLLSILTLNTEDKEEVRSYSAGTSLFAGNAPLQRIEYPIMHFCTWWQVISWKASQKYAL